MKRLLALLMALAMLLSLAACSGKVVGEGTAEAQEVTEEVTSAENTVEAEEVPAEEPAEEESDEEEPAEEETTGIANPWSDCADAAEAEEVSGLTLDYDISNVNGCAPTAITAMDGMIDIDYGTFTIRQGLSTGEDISGDYNENYIVIDGYEDCGVIFSCSWNDGYIALTTFDFGDCSYVIYTYDGFDYEELLPILTAITGVDSAEFDSGADPGIAG